MTCIVGLVEDGQVYLGADSAGVGGLSIITRADAKVFQVGEALIAICGSFRMGNLLRYGLKMPEHPDGMDPFQWMCTKFIDAVRECLKAGGFAHVNNGVEKLTHSAFIVGYRGQLYVVHDDLQVGQHYDPYMADGCGADIALGALHVLNNEDSEGFSPVAKLLAALRASATYSAGVRAPFRVLSLRGGQPNEVVADA